MKGIEKMDKKVLVVGCGLMGAGIAQVFAEAGIETYLCDVSRAVMEKGYNQIKHFLHRKVEKGKLEESQYECIISNIKLVDTYEAAGEVSVAIEVVSEDIAVKKKVFQELDRVLNKDALIATNTSTFSITELAGVTNRPDKIVGMHFFIPAPIMKLIEVIPGIRTSQKTIERAFELALSINKVPIKAPDTSAFLVNRLLVPMWNEAAFLVMEGNRPEDIDAAMKFGANLPMGPCELADFAGLDTVLAVLTEMYASFGEPKYRPCPLLKKMVAGKLLGKKSGKGFYDYSK